VTWPSDSRCAPEVLRQAVGLGGPLSPGLLEACHALTGWMKDDAALFCYACRLHAADPVQADRGALAWLAILAEHPARPRVWVAHRGAILYLLECAALAPAAWADAGTAIDALLDTAVFERAQAVPLRNGLCFMVVETFADVLGSELHMLDSAGRSVRLAAVPGELRALQRAPWDQARAAAQARRRAIRQRDAAGLGVPFETVCEPPWPSGAARLAWAFRVAAGIDVTLYDSAPLDVVLVCLLRTWHGLPAPSAPGWHDRLRHTLDALGRDRADDRE